MKGWQAVHVDEVETYDDGRCPFRALRHHLGIRAFGLTAWPAARAGDRLINEHEEDPGSEEVYVVMRGHARFLIDDEEVDAPAGSIVAVDPPARRTAFAVEDGTLVLAAGGTAGAPYVVEGWEAWAGRAQRHYAAGDFEAAVEAGRRLLEEDPGSPGLLYNVACCEARAGLLDDAVAHLLHAAGLAPSFVLEYAREDPDLEPVRRDPRVRALLGSES